jgi:hypothetical protein
VREQGPTLEPLGQLLIGVLVIGVLDANAQLLTGRGGTRLADNKSVDDEAPVR